MILKTEMKETNSSDLELEKLEKLEDNARKALEEAKKEAEVAKVTDISKFADYGVMITPALVVDGEVKCSGKVADVEEIKQWLK